MIRGTTPTVTFTLPFDTGVLESVWVTFSQNNAEVFTITKDKLTLNGTTILADISQANTLKLRSNCKVEIQIRGKTSDGKAIASNIMTSSVNRILKDGEI